MRISTHSVGVHEILNSNGRCLACGMSEEAIEWARMKSEDVLQIRAASEKGHS